MYAVVNNEKRARKKIPSYRVSCKKVVQVGTKHIKYIFDLVLYSVPLCFLNNSTFCLSLYVLTWRNRLVPTFFQKSGTSGYKSCFRRNLVPTFLKKVVHSLVPKMTALIPGQPTKDIYDPFHNVPLLEKKWVQSLDTKMTR